MTKKAGPGDVMGAWVERDLTALARKGDIAPAFEVEHIIDEVAALIEAGKRPVLVGEAGVGKTAVVLEMPDWAVF